MSPMPKPPGPQSPPPVQRVSLQYAKTGRLRFSSHRDFQRMLERALRRIDAPMAYSSGFSPHPKISFAGAAPTGTASLAEYVELQLVRRVQPEQFAAQLSAALPEGMGIEAAVESPGRGLADRLTGSVWHIGLPGCSHTSVATAASQLMSCKELMITKKTKKGPREVDARAAIVTLEVREPGDAVGHDTQSARHLPSGCAILEAVVRHTTPVVRPDDVLTALRDVANLAPDEPPVAIRLAQGLLDEDAATVADPLAAGA